MRASIISFNKNCHDISELYLPFSNLPPDLKVLILLFSGHLHRGRNSLCWFMFV